MSLAPRLTRCRRVVLVICIVLWVTAFVLTHISLPKPTGVPGRDKTLHGVGYAGLASVFLLTLVAYGHGSTRRILLTLATMAAYGAFDEFTQGLVGPGRSPSFRDWLFDIAGTVSALALWEFLLPLLSGSRSRR